VLKTGGGESGFKSLETVNLTMEGRSIPKIASAIFGMLRPYKWR
jgi:hypothetical protein